MQKLIVRNFGPIREFDLEIKNLSLFIGEQATGKSTVAKLVYFFKKIVKDELVAYLFNKPIPFDLDIDEPSWQLFLRFKEDLGWQFIELFFDSSNPPTSYSLYYKYKPDTWLHLDSNFKLPPTPYFTDAISEKSIAQSGIGVEVEDICDQIIKYHKKYLSGEMGVNEFEKEEKRTEIIKSINSFFGDENNTELIFIPASRSLFTVFSEHLTNKGWDMPMEDFWKKINTLKRLFRQPFYEIIEQKKLRGNGMATDEILNLTISKINKILKGEYRVEKDGEKIYFDDQEYVKISLASSGQKESLWILLQLFVLILNKEKVFLIIEEPEAHLYPEAQKSLVELMALLFNEENSQVLITTHSPYILTAFNNLIYAGNIGQKRGEVNKVIPEMLWLKSENVGAFKLKDGVAENLMDKETNLIRVEEIDSVSQNINQDFDALLNIELQ